MSDSASSRLEIVGRTDVGRKRKHNEDAFRIEPGIGLLVVADGMGGHELGEVASRLAADTAADHLLGRADARPQGANALARQLETVREAVQAANLRVYEENGTQGFREGAGMGTTIVGAWLLDPPDHLGVFHVGDSRLYCWRDGTLSQLTRDHTLYQDWLDHGAEGQAPRRNIILRALGPWAELEVDVALQRVFSGDIYLACSDGLSGLVDGAAVAAELARADADGDLDAACARLIDMALEAGGDDNVTVVLARCR